MTFIFIQLALISKISLIIVAFLTAIAILPINSFFIQTIYNNYTNFGFVMITICLYFLSTLLWTSFYYNVIFSFRNLYNIPSFIKKFKNLFKIPKFNYMKSSIIIGSLSLLFLSGYSINKYSNNPFNSITKSYNEYKSAQDSYEKLVFKTINNKNNKKTRLPASK